MILWFWPQAEYHVPLYEHKVEDSGVLLVLFTRDTVFVRAPHDTPHPPHKLLLVKRLQNWRRALTMFVHRHHLTEFTNSANTLLSAPEWTARLTIHLSSWVDRCTVKPLYSRHLGTNTEFRVERCSWFRSLFTFRKVISKCPQYMQGQLDSNVKHWTLQYISAAELWM